MRYIIPFIAWALVSCYRSDRQPMPANFYRLADSTSAARLIVTDTTDGFFEALRPCDMALQLAQPLHNLPDLHTAFRQALQRDVRNLNPAQAQKLHRAARLSYDRVVAFGRHFWIKPDFVVIAGSGYGREVWFTRENCIVLPLAALDTWPVPDLARIITHEMFHIWSRRHQVARSDLFGLFGFRRLPVPLILPESIDKKLLTNPDAVDINWYITASGPHRQRSAFVPLLVSRDTSEPIPYMQSLTLRWHEVDTANGRVSERGYDLSELPDIRKQLGNNTDYVLHPEEMVAEHFNLLVWGDPPAQDTTSRLLMQRVRETLANSAHFVH